jgi:hypothetical protein
VLQHRLWGGFAVVIALWAMGGTILVLLFFASLELLRCLSKKMAFRYRELVAIWLSPDCLAAIVAISGAVVYLGLT